ncbi:hypothetical protein LIT25_18510 [Bacillus sp. F19]|nr:hypothetical protein LIT25_18510 [Bacillus sp. F19]
MSTLDNIYQNKPKDGTVLGPLTKEELKTAREIKIKAETLGAIDINPKSFEDFEKYFAFVQEFETQRHDFWNPIMKRLGASWDWEVQADLVHGVAYVVNYDDPFYVQEDENDDDDDI